VYFVGGGNGGASSADILRISPPRGVVGRLPAAASDVAAATLGGTVYVVGGYDGRRPLDTIIGWRPGSGARVVGRLPQALRYAAVAPIANRLLIAGGTNGTTASAAIYSWAPGERLARRIGTLPTPLSHGGAGVIGDTVYLIGGRGSAQGTQSGAVRAVDPHTGRVTPTGRLPFPLADAGIASLRGRILVFGGQDRAGHVHDQIIEVRPR
jgi:N-acetylneuraminic acid mutarotase